MKPSAMPILISTVEPKQISSTQTIRLPAVQTNYLEKVTLSGLRMRTLQPYNPQQLGSIDAGQLAITAASTASASIAAAVASGAVAAGTATGAAGVLIAAGVGAQAVPIIGTVLGALAIIGGYLLLAKSKSKAIKSQFAEVDQANAALIIENAELDAMIIESENKITAINTDLTKAGLNGLESLKTFLKKTITPVRYQQGILENKQQTYNRLTKEADEKISLLETYQTQLQTLYDKLTGGKNLQKVLLIGGSVAVGATILWFVNHFKWIKL